MSKQVYQFRLTIKAAAWEFGMDAQTLTKKLKSQAILPDEKDGKYSVKQCADAIYGGSGEALRKEQIKDTAASAKLKTTKDVILKKEWIPISLVEKVWADYIRDLREKISHSSLSAQERAELLGELQTIPIENYYAGVDQKSEDEADEDAS
jgi:hypothetical protein